MDAPRPHEIPLLPNGAQILLNTLPPAETAADIVLGGKVWKSAPEMCLWIRENAVDFAEASVLELGSGTGACGLFCAGCGAARVVCTEGSEDAPQLLDLIESSIRRNCATWLPEDVVEAQRLDWGCDPKLLPDGPFDWIIASDCIYGSDDTDHIEICRTLWHVLSRDAMPSKRAAPRAILAMQHGIPAEAELGATSFIDEDLQQLCRAASLFGLKVRRLVSDASADLAVDVDEMLFPDEDFESGGVFLLEISVA
eukprot:TRINITY_DN21678_c1_g1_i1.p1 TRINITY_DN21678_c1_g1~~TRINITY_DN21678_c1_g1_i1.p1  ORF type:complete len:272 (-),score=50.51 TRINITY_DN21678_c1_g1_i1:273-1034(-)